MITYNAGGNINMGFGEAYPITNVFNNTLLFSEQNTNRLRAYNLSTFAFTSSSQVLTNQPAGICLVNSLSAMACFNSTSFDLIELATGYKQNYTGGVIGCQAAFTEGQKQIAGDISTGTGIYISSTSGVLGKFNSNTFTYSTLTIPIINSGGNNNFVTIVSVTSGTFMLGTVLGEIYEIDQNGNILDMFTISYADILVGRPGGGTKAVLDLAYGNNMLCASTGSALLLIDWSTKTILKTFPLDPLSNGANPHLCLSNMVSGVVLTAIENFQGGGSGQVICELDCTIQPFTVNDQLYTNNQNFVSGVGVNPNNGLGWSIGVNGALQFFSCLPRTAALRTITVQSASGSGINEQARLLILNDTGGVGTSKVILDTYMRSPATYLVPTGQTLIECVKVDLGENASWDLTRYNT